MKRILLAVTLLICIIGINTAMASDYVYWTVTVRAYANNPLNQLTNNHYAEVTTNGWDSRIQIQYFTGVSMDTDLQFVLHKPNPFPTGQGFPDPTWTSFVNEIPGSCEWVSPANGIYTTKLDTDFHLHTMNGNFR